MAKLLESFRNNDKDSSIYISVIIPPSPPHVWERQSISLPSGLNNTSSLLLCNGHVKTNNRITKNYTNIYPLLVSFLTVATTMLVTASILAWNYSETQHRRMTKTPNLILDHWGKTGPLLDRRRKEKVKQNELALNEGGLDTRYCQNLSLSTFCYVFINISRGSSISYVNVLIISIDLRRRYKTKYSNLLGVS